MLFSTGRDLCVREYMAWQTLPFIPQTSSTEFVTNNTI
jgi:hypothetical protein